MRPPPRGAGLLVALALTAPPARANGTDAARPQRPGHEERAAVPDHPQRAKPARRDGPAATFVPFANAPFPVGADSTVPTTGEPFFARDEGGRFHLAPRGGKLYEHPTYDDARSLLVVPSRFDPARPAALVVFLHGNGATLERDVVGRQAVVAQFERSGLNALLLAPQLAVDALDSSPGRFYEAGFLDSYLDEAARHLAARSGGHVTPAQVAALPLVLVAYSGGYLATAYALPAQSGTRRRIAGVILLDALFGEEAKFAAWLGAARGGAFFVDAYSPSSAALSATLAADLAGGGIGVAHRLPTSLRPGDVVLLPVPGAIHDDFVTAAWTRDPLAAVLATIDLSGSGSRTDAPPR